MVSQSLVTFHNNKNLLLNVEVSLDQVGSSHYRTVDSLFDILGDLGGIMEIILLCFTMVFLPIAEHNYLLTAANNLFFARCVQDDIFVHKKNQRVSKFVAGGVLNHSEATEVLKHRKIIISFTKNV